MRAGRLERDELGLRTKDCLWLHKNIAIDIVELVSAMPCKFEMLHLILPNRYVSGPDKVSI